MSEADIRLITHPPQSAARNMAIDEALLRLCQKPVLRIYEWSEPAVSIGYFQGAKEAPANRPIVRRYTGGGLVDHSNDFTYSVIVPRPHSLNQMGTAQSYEWIHRAVSVALEKTGTDSSLSGCCVESAVNACFQKPVKFDVMEGDTKLAGGAQRRTREGCLHQGSILHPRLSQAFQEVLTEEIRPLLGTSYIPSSLTPQEESLANELSESRYSTEAWNHSR